MYAATDDGLEMVQLLLKFGADLTLVDEVSSSPILRVMIFSESLS